MTPEERKLLEETHAMVEENGAILRSIRRSNRVAAVFRFLYWGIIIASSVGAYFLIQPYIETLKQVYSSVGIF